MVDCLTFSTKASHCSSEWVTFGPGLTYGWEFPVIQHGLVHAMQEIRKQENFKIQTKKISGGSKHFLLLKSREQDRYFSW